MKKTFQKLLSLTLLSIISLNFIGCKNNNPETPSPETPPATTPQIAQIQENKTYTFKNSNDETLMIKMLTNGEAILLDENETIFNGTFVNQDNIYTITVSEGNKTIPYESDFHELTTLPISQNNIEEHTFVIQGTENSVQITETTTIGTKKINSAKTLEIVNDNLIIEDGLYDAKYYYNQSHSTWTEAPVSGDTCLYVNESCGIYSANGFACDIKTYSLGNFTFAKIQQASEIMWTLIQTEEIENEYYLTMFGAAFIKTTSVMDFTLTEDLTFTANCCYNIDYDTEITTKITKNQNNQNLSFSLTLKQNGNVEFVGPKGIVQTGKWIASISKIIISLDNYDINSSIKHFELVSLSQYGTPMLNANQEDIIENATSMFVVGATEFFTIAWTESSIEYFDSLVQ